MFSLAIRIGFEIGHFRANPKAHLSVLSYKLYDITYMVSLKSLKPGTFFEIPDAGHVFERAVGKNEKLETFKLESSR